MLKANSSINMEHQGQDLMQANAKALIIYTVLLLKCNNTGFTRS